MTKPLARLFAALLLALLVASPALARKKSKQLDDAMQAYSAAVRWGEFDRAQAFIDPAYQQAHPLSDWQLQRYQQVQISGYRELAVGEDGDGGVLRDIEVRAINKHTQAERVVRYTEHWRYDAAGKRWWLVAGLPDLWNGE